MHNYFFYFGNEKDKNDNLNEMKNDKRSFPESSLVENKACEISKQTFSRPMEESEKKIVLLPSAIVKYQLGDEVSKARILLDMDSAQVTMII